MSESNGRLGEAAKAALLSLAGSWESVRAAPPPGTAAAPAPPESAPFAGLPAYRDMLRQRAAAAALGLADPFFRLHEGRAGATTVIDGRECVNFASYDYLGLNAHPEIAAAAKAAIDRYGVSASASRVVAGEREATRALERALADLYGAEEAVVFVSGHATNVNVVAELVGAGDLILHDALIHNSVLVGARLSGAMRRAFPHNDFDALEAILAQMRDKARNVLIVVEGLYSMDGDTPDLARLADIKRRFGCWLMVDEAHALGVLGQSGRGSAEAQAFDAAAVDVWMGTLSKTLAACGGYVAGSAPLIDLLKCNAPGFVYSVGLAPPLAAAALAALRVMAAEPERTARLAANGRRFCDAARAAGLDLGLGQGHAIAPVMTGHSLRAVRLSERLLARGVNALPIIHPAVPPRSARLRFFLSSEHSPAQIDAAITALAEESERLGPEDFWLAAARPGSGDVA